jgi:AcrR family transcriptional regulator
MPATAPAPQASVGRRERKKQATRQALHEAAMDLVEERGLANATVEDITERADVSVRTFFNHFSSKEEAVIERDPDRAARLVAAITARPAGEVPLVALREAMLSDAFLAELTPAQMRRRMRLVRSEPTLQPLLTAHFDEMLAEVSAAVARRTGADPGDLYPTLAASAAFMAVKVALLRWCDHDGALELADVIAQAFAHLATGLVPPTAPPDPEILS